MRVGRNRTVFMLAMQLRALAREKPNASLTSLLPRVKLQLLKMYPNLNDTQVSEVLGHVLQSVDLKPGEYCRLAGMYQTDVCVATGQSAQNIINWARDKPALFDAVMLATLLNVTDLWGLFNDL